MKNIGLILIFVLLFSCSSCALIKKQENEFLFVEITRWMGTEGIEILLLFKTGENWSATLMSYDVRGCRYEREIKPNSSWENLWLSLQNEGLLEITEGIHQSDCCNIGNDFNVNIEYQNKTKKYSFQNPVTINSDEAKQILKIGEVIKREFDAPLFAADFNKNQTKNYFDDIGKKLKCEVIK